MATSKIQILIEADDKAGAKLKALAAGLEDVGKKGEKASFNIRDAMKGVTAALAGAAVVAGVFKKAMDFAKEGAQLQRLEAAGDKMATSFGQNMDDLVGAIQRATNGAIPAFEAMGLANRALLLGVAETPEQFTKLATAAAALGQAMGRTSSEAMTDIVTGIGRMSPLILDNLGIMTRGGKVFDEYAASVGTTADKLTDTQKKQILLNSALLAAQPLLSADGKIVADNATSWEALSAQIKDATDNAKSWLADGLTPILSGFQSLSLAIGDQGDLLLQQAPTYMDYLRIWGEQSFIMQNLGHMLNRAEFEAAKLASAEETATRKAEEMGATLAALPLGIDIPVDITIVKPETFKDKVLGILAASNEAVATSGAESAALWIDGWMANNPGKIAAEGFAAFVDEMGSSLGEGNLSNTILGKLSRAQVDAAAVAVSAGDANSWRSATRLSEAFGGSVHKWYLEVLAAIAALGGAKTPRQQTVNAGFGQHGLNMIVPPGFPNDSFPIMVSSGERVVVSPQSTDNSRNMTFNGGMTFNNGQDLSSFQSMLRRSLGGE